MIVKNVFALKLSVLAVTALFATGAQALGTVSFPSTAAIPVAAVQYAGENISPTAATMFTLAPITYTMGVGRGAAGQDMTIIYTFPPGMTLPLAPPVPVFARAIGHIANPLIDCVPTVAVKRVGANEVVYSVTVNGSNLAGAGLIGINPGDTFTSAALMNFTSAVAPAAGSITTGSVVDVTVKLLDQVETACVDNAGLPATCSVSSRVASVANAADFWNSTTGIVGVMADTNQTTTNVNATIPLAGFVAQVGGTGGSPLADDSTTVAKAAVQVRTMIGAKQVGAPALAYALLAGDLVTVTVTDPTSFLGLAAAGLKFGTLPMTIIAATPTSASTAATAGNNPNFNATAAGGAALNNFVSYTSNATTPMGTSRVLGISGGVAPAAGIAHAFTPNATWWTWNSNGTILETPFFTNAVGYNNRFVFMNYSANAVTYSTQCLVETGNTAIAVLPTALVPNASTGTLAANGQTVIQSTNVCTITPALGGSLRGAVRFTINAPSSVVKGVYNTLNTVSGDMSSVEMARPTGGSSTQF